MISSRTPGLPHSCFMHIPRVTTPLAPQHRTRRTSARRAYGREAAGQQFNGAATARLPSQRRNVTPAKPRLIAVQSWHELAQWQGGTARQCHSVTQHQCDAMPDTVLTSTTLARLALCLCRAAPSSAAAAAPLRRAFRHRPPPCLIAGARFSAAYRCNAMRHAQLSASQYHKRPPGLATSHIKLKHASSFTA